MSGPYFLQVPFESTGAALAKEDTPEGRRTVHVARASPEGLVSCSERRQAGRAGFARRHRPSGRLEAF
jgi:hypothetical protein